VVTADSADPLVPLLNTFGVFAVGFSMRPLAGLLPGSVAEASVRHPELFPWSVAVRAGRLRAAAGDRPSAPRLTRATVDR